MQAGMHSYLHTFCILAFISTYMHIQSILFCFSSCIKYICAQGSA